MPPPQPLSGSSAASGVRSLLTAYGRAWADADFAALAGCWEEEDAAPVYLGLEYPEPIVGWSELNRHWSRLAARISAAEMSWDDLEVKTLAPEVAAFVALATWELRVVESDQPNRGQSWVAAIARRRGGVWRFTQYVESPAYFPS